MKKDPTWQGDEKFSPSVQVSMMVRREVQADQDPTHEDLASMQICNAEKEDNADEENRDLEDEKGYETTLGKESCSEDNGGEEGRDLDNNGEPSEEEVDEDDEEAVLNMLQGKGTFSMEVNSEKIPNLSKEKSPAKHLPVDGSKKKTKKRDFEELHAESQRLLRETRGIAFKSK
eukprot:c35375_g1_i1 orf=2-523(+)